MKTRIHKKVKSIRKPALAKFYQDKRLSYGVILLIAVLGTVFLAFSRAATFSVAVEPESGTLTGCAKAADDSSASGSKAVSFGCPVAPTGFVHPGILVNKAQLDFTKAKIKAGQQPWLGAYQTMSSNRYANRSYTPHPVVEVKCSTSESDKATYPQAGCPAMRDDAQAAYTQALMWYYSDDPVYAQNAVKIINAWSSMHTKTWMEQPRLVDGVVKYGLPGENRKACNGGKDNCPQVYASGLLDTAWTAEEITRGAEIIRYSYSGWSAADITKAENYFKKVHMDALGTGWTRTTNWEMSVAEAWTNIGIFTNDRAIYNKGLAYWRQEVPRYIYITSDGAAPLSSEKTMTYPIGADGKPYLKTEIKEVSVDVLKDVGWWKTPSFMNGQMAETCRDIGHSFMGLGAISSTAETARIQGVDLYGEQKDRMVAAYELHAQYVNEVVDRMVAAGKPITGTKAGDDFNAVAASGGKPKNAPWVCPNFNGGGGSALVGTELAYNYFANKKGIAMPNTKKAVERLRTQQGGNHLLWETVTHANNPN